MKISNIRIGHKILVAFAVLVVVAGAVSATTYARITNTRAANKEAQRTAYLVSKIEHLELTALDQVGYIRALLITGDQRLIAGYEGAQRVFDATYMQAMGDVGGDQRLSSALAAVRDLVHQWQSDVAAVQIARMKNPLTVNEARAIEVSGAGQEFTGTLRREVDAILTTQNTRFRELSAQMEKDFATTVTVTLIGGIALLVLAVALAILLTRAIASPIRAITGTMGRLANGDTGVELPWATRKDEVGEMARAVQVFKDNAIERARLEAEQTAERDAKERRAQAIEELILGFDRSMADMLRTVSSATTELESTARSMASVAEQTNQQAGASAAAAEQTSANVQTVSAAAEEMASSIQEISRQVAQSASIANQAASEAERTDGTVQGLAEAAQRIGEVVELITNIAAQTNLLALNATIEAARAGEAGKGFAVVANEVKSLANQTAKATDEIASQITAIQGATGSTVEAIRGIGATIATMNEISSAIAAAVEEQQATTQEIARNVNQAAEGTREVSTNVVHVTQGAGQTGAAASQVLSAAGELARQAEGLRAEVERFLGGIRAA